MQDVETRVDTLADIDLFMDLPTREIRVIEESCRWLRFAAGDTVFERDAVSDGVYFVVSGAARVLNETQGGDPVTFADVRGGNFFGELSCVGESRRSARVVATEDSVIAVMSRDDFVAALKTFPDMALKLIDHLSSVIRKSNERLTDLVDLSPDQRIYAELLRLATPSGRDDNTWLIDPLPRHSEISGRAGTESQDVSLAVGALIREGVARRRDNSLIISNYPRLRMLRGL